jgi:hypothetical protein
MAIDIFLNTLTGDIDLFNKSMRLTNSIPESSRQQVHIDLSTFKGEWFANILAGIPYLANDNNPIQLMGQQETLNFDIAIKGNVLSRENIVSLSGYTSSLDRKERILTVSFTAITSTGEEVEVLNLPVGI